MNHPLLELLEQDVVLSAKSLVGAHLVFGPLRAVIVEAEAYGGEQDPASHGYRGITPRNRIMFGAPGFAYMYLNYGMHWLLNVTANPPNRAGAVLIRAAMPVEGLETMRLRRSHPSKPLADQDLLSGPGKLAQAFGLNRDHYGVNLLDPNSQLRIVAAPEVRETLAGPRVGIPPGKGDQTPWRFIDAERIQWASRPRPKIAQP